MIQFGTVKPGTPPGHRRPPIPARAVPAAQSIDTESCLPSTSGTALLEIIVNTSTISKIVLGILGVFSVVSWGIILQKWWMFRRTKKQSASFLEVFRRSSKFSEVQAVCASLKDSPL